MLLSTRFHLLCHDRFGRDAHMTSTSATSSRTSTRFLMLRLLLLLLLPCIFKLSGETERSTRPILSCAEFRLMRNWSSERLIIVVVIAQTKLSEEHGHELQSDTMGV